MLRDGFEHAGSLDNPSIFLDSAGEKIYICGGRVDNYLRIYINVLNEKITDVKYLCFCDPTSNVIVEILCSLIKDKNISEAEALTPDSFVSYLGGGGEVFIKRSIEIIKLLRRGIDRYKSAR